MHSFYIIVKYPLIESQTEILDNRDSGRIKSGYYLYVHQEIEKGIIKFTYQTSRNVDSFIMTEAQFYGFSEYDYVGSEDAINNNQYGVLLVR